MADSDVLREAGKALDLEPGSACLVDTGGRILHCNPAWDRFAAENAAPPSVLARNVEGTTWLAGIAGEVRGRFEEVLRRALAGQARSQPGECNSAELHREVMSHFVPVLRGTRDVVGVGVVCSVLRVSPLGAVYQPAPPDEALYRGPSGLLRMCSNCRRVARVGPEPVRWDFVPAWVAARRVDVTHGLCPTCMELQFGDLLRT